MATVRKEKAKINRRAASRAPHWPVRLPARGAKAFDVVGLGESSVDLVAEVRGFPAADGKQALESFNVMVGGQTATAMIACARQGWRARYVGGLGNDAYAEQVVATLEREGVDPAVTRTADARSRFAVILVDREAGTRSVLEGRDDRAGLTVERLNRTVVTSGRVLLLDAVAPAAAICAARWARAEGIATVLDVDDVSAGLDDLLPEIDVLIAGARFPPAWTGAKTLGQGLARLAAEYQSAVVIATLGAEGSLARSGGREIRTPAFRVPVVDTTGAGDAFRGGFIAGWLRFGDSAILADLLVYANAVAGLNCRRLGAIAGLPTRSETDALVTGTDHAWSK